MSTNAVLEGIAAAFGNIPRPEHFTNYLHCEECAEHDATLRQHTPDTIGLAELGNAGWDPICFISTEGYLYYMPGLARLALGTGEDYYLFQFLFQLNGRRPAFSPEQRAAVVALLEYIYTTMRTEVAATPFDLDALENAILDLSD